MDKSSCLIDLLALNVSVGDLVRLQGDDDMEAGLGLVTKIKRGSEDLLDLLEGIDWFVGKPQVMVLWTKTNKHSIWMDAEEVALVRSVGVPVNIF